MCHRRGGSSSSRKPASSGIDRPPLPHPPPLLGGSQEKTRHQPRVGPCPREGHGHAACLLVRSPHSYWGVPRTFLGAAVKEGGEKRMSRRGNVQPPVNGTGLNGTGSAYPRIIVHKCLCCFLLAAGSRGCRGRPRARINAISLRGPEHLRVWIPGAGGPRASPPH